ncbi:MAG: 3-hydroxybutyrate dehydrogenase [Betaproteobacteria bacterium]|nr:3-hydroxybutyrate dehydrogenase [Betaproteobacteria bacterium]
MLKGRNAVITGSTSGIGLGIARALAREGASVMLNGFGDAAEIEKLRAGMASEFGVKVLHSPADMTRPAEIRAMIARAAKELGSVDILVNNAGIQFVSPVAEFPEDKWDQIIAVNMSSNFHTVKAALPLMRANGWGRIINISSAHGLVASPFKSAYVAAKHGVNGMTKTIALEVARENITCNAICPGYVRTPLVDKQVDDQARVHGIPPERVITEVILKPQPTQRFVEIDEVAGIAVFLCSPAGMSINGAALSMDGGWTAT